MGSVIIKKTSPGIFEEFIDPDIGICFIEGHTEFYTDKMLINKAYRKNLTFTKNHSNIVISGKPNNSDYSSEVGC